MTVDEYLRQGRELKLQGRPTDGCSFIGWLLDDKYEPACWAHDFGRNGLIHFDDESDNENLFKNALRELGMSDFASNMISIFTRTQGFVRDKTGIPAVTFAGMLMFIIIMALLFWHSEARANEVTMDPSLPDQDTLI